MRVQISFLTGERLCSADQQQHQQAAWAKIVVPVCGPCRCSQAGITMAQLHGDGARSALAGLQGQHLQVIYVMHAKPDGQLITARPPPDSCDWVLVDGIQVSHKE